MKKSKYLIFLVISFMFGMIMVKSAETDYGVQITGENTFGKSLLISNCSSNDYCMFKTAKWYYNDTNSTEGGTEITSNAGNRTFKIPKELVGKYIYVVAEFYVQGTDGGSLFNQETIKDITDAQNNKTATVDNYIHTVDTNNYSIDVKVKKEGGSRQDVLEMKLKGYEQAGNVRYFLYFTNDNKQPTIEEDDLGCSVSHTRCEENDTNCTLTLNYDSYDINLFKEAENDGTINIADDWYLLKGYTNVFVVKEKRAGGYYCEVTKNPIKIQKPALPSLGTRYTIFARPKKNSLVSFINFPFEGYNGSHTLINKIGLIEDNDLLKALAKDKEGNLDKLLAYAKKADGKSFKYSDRLYTYEGDFSTFNIVDGKYYYVYTTYENKDGLYRNLDDINVYQGKDNVLQESIRWDASLLSENNNNNNNNNNNPTTETPKTENPKNEETKSQEVKTWEFEIKYEANGGEGTMKSQTGKSNEPIVLAKNEFKYEKPNKQIFMGWNLYIEDETGKRELVKDEKGKMIRFEEGSKVENIKVLSGYKLVAVAEWTPATGIIEIGALIVGVSTLLVVGYNYLKKKNIIAKI